MISMLSDFKLTSPLKALYCSLVRPLLEYGSVLEDPYIASDSAIIEQVQKRFISYAGHDVLNFPRPPHNCSSVMLHDLGLATLTDWRDDINLNFFRNLIDGSAVACIRFVPSSTYKILCPSTPDPHSRHFCYSHTGSDYYGPLFMVRTNQLIAIAWCALLTSTLRSFADRETWSRFTSADVLLACMIHTRSYCTLGQARIR